MEQDKSEFSITGTVTSVNSGRTGKATFLKVRVSGVREKYLEATAFYTVTGVGKGDRVRVTGTIGSKKLEGVPKRMGTNNREYDTWVTDLIAERVEVLEEGQPSLAGTKRGAQAPDDDIPF